MPDCDYCGESFGSEKAYHRHLRNEHADELGPIDRRRVGATGGESRLPTGPIALVAVIGLAVIVVGYVTFVAGGGGAGEPYALGSVHFHGTINVSIAGDELDFSSPKFQHQARAFHFEAGTAIWHVHARGVTLAHAMETVGIELTEDSVTYRGTTYRDSDPNVEVIVEVNGEPVNPEEYVLDSGVAERAAQNGKGPHIHIVVKKT